MARVLDVRATQDFKLCEEHTKKAGDKCTVHAVQGKDHCILLTWSGWYAVSKEWLDLENPIAVVSED